MNRDVFAIALREFAADADAGPDRQIALVLDGAGWHHATLAAGDVPAHVHLVFLPPYSPELQPAERIWPLINERVANRSFSSIDDLERAVGERAVEVMHDPDYVGALTRYHWWPVDVQPDAPNH